MHSIFATAIGSFPHDDVQKAIKIIIDTLPDAPVWPQLPKIGLTEQMEIQYSEGMPRAIIDSEKGKLVFNTTGDYSEELAQFYEAYMNATEGDGNFEPFAISPQFSKGIYALEAQIAQERKKYPYVKVHTTGPCSFSLTVVDDKKRAIYYNEEFRDVIVKALAMKSRWQIKKFSPFANKIICFIDEPILTAFGSSTYIAVKREDVILLIKEMVDAIHAENAIAGVHCCGNTEWPLLVEAGVDMVNLDAYLYGETISLYPDAVKSFIAKGGIIAWGIVPTSVHIREEDALSLAKRLDSLLNLLAAKTNMPKELLFAHSIVTPSCGTGSMSIDDAERVFFVLKELTDFLKTQ
ncbi:MAG: hypothetical protein N2316_12625 [Spirochaetes bacterium]|nr:hypothetical protein [Spirochaetota bacterium]